MFPEYSHSKRFSITPDIVEFDDPKLAPPFDLIIGTATMEDLGIILDFETKMIAIDGMNIPMRNIKNLQVPGTRFQIWKNSWFVEPIVTNDATRRAIKILDAKYEQADLPKIVQEKCKHLTNKEKNSTIKITYGISGSFRWYLRRLED